MWLLVFAMLMAGTVAAYTYSERIKHFNMFIMWAAFTVYTAWTVMQRV